MRAGHRLAFPAGAKATLDAMPARLVYRRRGIGGGMSPAVVLEAAAMCAGRRRRFRGTVSIHPATGGPGPWSPRGDATFAVGSDRYVLGPRGRWRPISAVTAACPIITGGGRWRVVRVDVEGED